MEESREVRDEGGKRREEEIDRSGGRMSGDVLSASKEMTG